MIICLLNGYAGVLRDRSKNISVGSDSKTMKKGILLCVLGAICAAGFNLSYHVGNNLGKIGEVAQVQFGNEPWIARLAVLLPIFMGAALSTMIYFTYTITKRKAWGNFTGKGAWVGLLLILAMAVFHDAALVIYGLGAYKLGELGTSVGFAILETGAIMVANINGLLTKEWAGASKKSIRVLVISLSILIIGVLFIAKANYMKIESDALAFSTILKNTLHVFELMSCYSVKKSIFVKEMKTNTTHITVLVAFCKHSIRLMMVKNHSSRTVLYDSM